MKQLFPSFLLLALALTVACGGGAPAEPTVPPPTATPIIYPATFTPPAPETPLPSVTPTETTVPATRTPDADTQKVSAAFVRTARIAAYYINLTVTVVDPFGSTPNVQAGEPFKALGLEGRLNQTESTWHITGQEAIALGGDAEKGVDLLTVGGSVYVKGPATRLGAPEARWYSSGLAPDAPQNQYPQLLLNQFADNAALFPTMRAIQPETLDGFACTKYQSDEGEMSTLVAALLAATTQPAGVTRRDILFVSVCDDGYVHQWEWYYELTDPAHPDAKGTSNNVMHLSDIKIIVPLQPPPDAIPAQNQQPLPPANPFPFAKPTTTS